jgi:hypothetical protein
VGIDGTACDQDRTDDSNANAERTTRTRTSTSDGRTQPPAETRTREQYADDIRADRNTDENQGQTATSARDQRGSGLLPETITFENKDIEVTHDAADGIWVEGLPGDPPARIGGILPSPEESERSRIDNLREELTKDADDLIDMGGKWTDLLRDTLGSPPPTNSMTHSRAPEIARAFADELLG